MDRNKSALKLNQKGLAIAEQSAEWSWMIFAVVRVLFAIGLLWLAGCKEGKPELPVPGADVPRDNNNSSSGLAPVSEQQRILYAQIVEDDDPRKYTESAIIEGKPFKSFLKSLIGAKQDDLRKLTNDAIVFDRLMTQPGLYRGQVVTLARGVVVEVDKVPLPPEYGLDGYSVLVGVFVDSARDVYAFRILSPPGSDQYEKLRKGIDTDSVPVGRLCGYFMKLYARNTGDPKEPPWRRPLLICPEMEFSKVAPSRHILEELSRNHMDRFLPSERIEAPGAEERLVVEILPGTGGERWRLRAEGEELSSADAAKAPVGSVIPVSLPKESGGNDLFLDPDAKDENRLPPPVAADRNAGLKAYIAKVVESLKKRLPKPQDQFPSAVILITSGAPRAPVTDLVSALRAAGVERLALKSER